MSGARDTRSRHLQRTRDVDRRFLALWHSARAMSFACALALTLSTAAIPSTQASSPDRWAPGVADGHWELIQKLQAWPAFSASDPPWDTAIGHRDPIVRAAAAAALGRGRPLDAARRLTLLVNDESELVRSVALWALLQIPSDGIKEPLLGLLSAWPHVDSASYDSRNGEPLGGYGPLFERVGLPADVGELRWDERVEWMSRFDRASWRIPSGRSIPRRARALCTALSAQRSEWDAGEDTTLEGSFEAAGLDGPLDVSLEGSWYQLRAFPGTVPAMTRRVAPTLRTLDGAARLRMHAPTARERLRLQGELALAPGVYVFQGPARGNPLFFRVRRNAASEAKVEHLIAAATQDSGAVQSLGELRVRAAAPQLVRLLRDWDKTPEGSGHDRPTGERRAWDRVALVVALVRIEDPAAAEAVVAEVLARPSVMIGDVGVELSSAVLALGELGRPSVEAQVLNWRQHLSTGHAGALASAVEFPGFAPASPFAMAVEDLATTLCMTVPRTPDVGRAWLLRAALRSLAHFKPDRALVLVTEALRRPSADPLLSRGDLPDVDAAYRSVLERAWGILRDDPSVSPEAKSDLARVAFPYERSMGAVTLSGKALQDWLARATLWCDPPARVDQCVRVARESLAHGRDPISISFLAELERRRGRWAEAIQLAEEARPHLKGDRQAYADSVLGLAHAALGDVDEALSELKAAGTGPAAGVSSYERDGWRRNLETRPVRPGLRIRYERARPAELAAGGFWVEKANRLRFSANRTDAGELVAVTTEAPTQIVATDSRRAVLRLADGTLAAYEAGRAAPLWSRESQPAPRRIAFAPGAVLVQTEADVSALDPDTGHLLWVRKDSRLLCDEALHLLPGVPLTTGATTARGEARLLRMHERSNGEPMWTILLAREPSLCAADRSYVVWADGENVLGLAETATGRQLWSARLGWDTAHDAWAHAPNELTLPEGAPIIVRNGDVILALDPLSAHERWRFRWEQPAGSDPRPELRVAAAGVATYVVAAWNHSVALHEVIRLDERGVVSARLVGPAHPGGLGVLGARADADGVTLWRGDLDEIWNFGSDGR